MKPINLSQSVTLILYTAFRKVPGEGGGQELVSDRSDNNLQSNHIDAVSTKIPFKKTNID